MATSVKARSNIKVPGVRAKESYVRISASKIRSVLDLVRGKSYEKATEILSLVERKPASYVQRCLDSAVNNAENNNNIPPEELYISECFADEGLTLKRWRARARGRATRIRKRTSTITVIVSRYSAEQLDEMHRVETSKAGSSKAASSKARSRRVQASKKTESPETESKQTEESDISDNADPSAPVDDSPTASTQDADEPDTSNDDNQPEDQLESKVEEEKEA